jgi:hypothetical protein
MGWVAVAASAVSAISSIQQGEAANREAKINAALLEGKAGLIDVQKGIQYAQDTRGMGQAMGTTMANIAASGVQAKGSPMAVLLDQQTQMGIDRAIGQFNLEQSKRYTMAEADAQRRAGKQAVKSGYMNAFSSVLQGASNYGYYKGWGTAKPSLTTQNSGGGSAKITYSSSSTQRSGFSQADKNIFASMKRK